MRVRFSLGVLPSAAGVPSEPDARLVTRTNTCHVYGKCFFAPAALSLAPVFFPFSPVFLPFSPVILSYSPISLPSCSEREGII